MDSIILLSGGMDSALSAGIACQECNEPLFIHFQYGQRTWKKERECFEKVSHYYQAVKKEIIDLDFFKKIGNSSLTDPSLEVPQGQLLKEIPNTYVPFRNGVFLAYAVALAEKYKIKKIYIGAVDEDSSGYPDCRIGFFDHLNQALKIGTVLSDIEIITPVIHMSKTEIVQAAKRLNVPLHLTWSCYIDGSLACGQCDSCLLRLKAFSQAGYVDPIPYRK